MKRNRWHWQNDWPVVIILLILISIWLALGGVQPVRWSIASAVAAPLTLGAALALLLLPGLALLRLLWPDPLPLIERWPLAIGVSCALQPLLLLLSQPLGIHWNTWNGWGYLVVSALVACWPRAGTPVKKPPKITWQTHRTHALLLVMTLLAVLVRLYTARELLVGMWGDSYHHTVIAQLLADHGGLFSSWQPYVPLKTFTYHYGFHSIVAWLQWLSGHPVTLGVPLVGQLQSALAVPLIYLLTRRVCGNEPMALWAALIVGFISPMPGYYVNWGRYTQLAGQTILPAVAVIWMALLDKTTNAPRAYAPIIRLTGLAALVTAGLALTHYRVTLFAVCFILVYGIYLLATRIRSLGELAAVGAVGLATNTLVISLIVPWIMRLRESMWARLGTHYLSTNTVTTETDALPTLSEFVALHTKPAIMALALVGILSLLWQRQWRGMVLVGWALLVWFLTNPYMLGLPGAGIISNFTVLIANYLVLAPLAGAALVFVSNSLARAIPAPRLLAGGQVFLGAAVMFWGMGYQQQIITPQSQLFTPADAMAMDWIKQHTPPDAAFFVNSFPAYGGSLYAGSDGGWWLAFMSGRATNIPPLLYGSEAGEQPDYPQTIHETNRLLLQEPLERAETAAALRTHGFTYLYDGPAAAPPGEYVNPAILAQSPWYELVYSQDGVTIWRIR